MDLLLFTLLGLVAGWLASVLLGTRSPNGLLMDILLGVIGAVMGGFIMSFFGETQITGINMIAVAVASVVALTSIWIGRQLPVE